MESRDRQRLIGTPIFHKQLNMSSRTLPMKVAKSYRTTSQQRSIRVSQPEFISPNNLQENGANSRALGDARKVGRRRSPPRYPPHPLLVFGQRDPFRGSTSPKKSASRNGANSGDMTLDFGANIGAIQLASICPAVGDARGLFAVYPVTRDASLCSRVSFRRKRTDGNSASRSVS